ncbi:MAG: glutamyl-tRNA reductase, partial [Deltaproteobacteria bacterium]|nr:glutamyl-tRNA reductase [Deltaproteobacteria bacterium]
DLYDDLKQLESVNEGVVISTCNRVEVLLATPSMAEQAIEGVKSFLSKKTNVAVSDFAEHLYIHQAQDAVNHVYRVVSSLDSMVVGEPQILGQVKDTYREALDHHSSGVVLNRLLQKAFSTAKRVRTETGIANHAVSISYAAVELARKIFGELTGKKILLIGAGEMAELAVEHLRHQHVSDITIANRTLENALTLARRYEGQAISLEEIPAQLVNMDIVITSTGSPDPVITAKMVRSILRARKHKPLFFVDIAVPRDIEPAVNDLGNVYLYNIDDLEGLVDENKALRSNETARAERIIEEETIKFINWLASMEIAPTIIALREKTEEIRRAELGRTLSKQNSFSQDQIDALETMTKALVHKVIHDPILFIKKPDDDKKKESSVELIRNLFNLNEGSSD